MTNRERENRTLQFGHPDRGSIEETFYPWSLTRDRYIREGIPREIAMAAGDITNDLAGNKANQAEKYLPVSWGEGVMAYEQYLGFDPVRRIHFVLPFRRFEEKVLEQTPDCTIKQDIFGRQLIHNSKTQGSDLFLVHREVVQGPDDWKRLRERGDRELEANFSDAAIDAAYAPLKAGHDRGDYSVRLNIEGFFWVPRELMGTEAYMYAFYDEPEMLHDMAEYICRIYETKLMRVIRLLQPDVVYIMEDLSGRNGPLISGAFFDEFLAPYYRRITSLLKAAGVGTVAVDTDGVFSQIIPNFLAAGVECFLPMDVNAGMDIVAVRRQFPNLRFIGGFNKLLIEAGPEAIDREFARLLPVVRQGGYIVGADHQVTPNTPLANYRYYIKRLGEVMAQAGLDL
jgi:hypothetical protein